MCYSLWCNAPTMLPACGRQEFWYGIYGHHINSKLYSSFMIPFVCMGPFLYTYNNVSFHMNHRSLDLDLLNRPLKTQHEGKIK